MSTVDFTLFYFFERLIAANLPELPTGGSQGLFLIPEINASFFHVELILVLHGFFESIDLRR